MELLVVELKSKLAASEDNLRSMLESNDTSVVGMQRSVAELRTANDNLQKQLKESRNEAEQARRQAEDANLRSVSLRNSGDTATRSNAELERSLADVRAALESREKELAVLEERYSRAEVERSISLEKAAVLEDERRLLEGDIRSVTNAKALWEGRCSTLRREKEELEHSLQKARQEIVENRGEEVSLTKGRLEALSASKRSQDSPTGRNDGSPSYFQRSLSGSNSMLNSSPSREAKELHELRGKVAVLEGLIKKKTMEMDSLKRDYSSKESDLYNKIELLQMANDQLIQGGPDLGMDQLQMELQRLQNQCSILARRERELVSQLSTQEVPHKFIGFKRSCENEQIESRFNRFKDTAKFGNLMDKVIALDNESSEQIETNAMYKEQLRRGSQRHCNSRIRRIGVCRRGPRQHTHTHVATALAPALINSQYASLYPNPACHSLPILPNPPILLLFHDCDLHSSSQQLHEHHQPATHLPTSSYSPTHASFTASQVSKPPQTRLTLTCQTCRDLENVVPHSPPRSPLSFSSSSSRRTFFTASSPSLSVARLVPAGSQETDDLLPAINSTLHPLQLARTRILSNPPQSTKLSTTERMETQAVAHDHNDKHLLL
ncbi:hypothetical protein MPTK1_5g03280 [Marchantia polymorpha subsp. ruderalis]|uniref:Uncharacterized protein n=2 Tax=Marchantia polymorpha TaxID=3197 RepID=A0AAF6BEG8_MARPO|nr:hypothetical protein MARPO_0310s0002 [Marchantia polymorpha]BBN10402.1 hypothetical protein Mp_5g03280 [Marchantia polymorpha subsp. ruderalis]|eukprot:PTQ26856.1 hypothetical protein MARPO_0310s0002 [Marchantia polymorpha]